MKTYDQIMKERAKKDRTNYVIIILALVAIVYVASSI